MKTMKVFGVVLVATAASMALPAMADPDLDASIDAIACPVDDDTAGSITVLGKTSAILPANDLMPTEFKGDGFPPLTCADLGAGDRVKVSCTDQSCDTAKSVKFDGVSAESSVAGVNRGCEVLASQPPTFVVRLNNGVFCRLGLDTEVKQKKKPNFIGAANADAPTQAELFDFLCVNPDTVFGVTPGTMEVKCTGFASPVNFIDATKIELKK